MSRVLIYTSPAKGHLTPVKTAAIELAGRGHSVHMRTLAGEVEGVRALGLEASAIDPRIEDRELDDWRATTTMAALKRSMQTFADRAPYEVEDLRSAITRSPPTRSLLIPTRGERRRRRRLPPCRGRCSSPTSHLCRRRVCRPLGQVCQE